MDRKEFARKFPDEASARKFFENIIWKDGRICPHCGLVDKSWKIFSQKAATGTYQCSDPLCRALFTVTTRTPLHSTKLPLIKWIEAIWFITEFSKGISSVNLARAIGVTQKTAWKMGHAIRLLMEQHGARKLDGVVEVDEKYLGGKPRKKHGVKHPRGMGTKKQGILVAVERGGGQVRAALIQSSSIINIGTELRLMVEKTAHLMTDENPSYRMIGKLYAKHEAVKHKGAIYAVGNVHNNTAESFNATLERAKIGVFHWMSKDHMPLATYRRRSIAGTRVGKPIRFRPNRGRPRRSSSRRRSRIALPRWWRVRSASGSSGRRAAGSRRLHPRPAGRVEEAALVISRTLCPENLSSPYRPNWRSLTKCIKA